MPLETPETWLCPIDGLVRMKYGTTCPDFADRSCENIQHAHITGQMYLTDKETSTEEDLGLSALAKDVSK